MRRIAALVEYDGTAFHGFQIQRGERTVQQVLEQAVSRITGTEVRVTGAGRTDAGAHAMGQVVHFDTQNSIPEDRWADALNASLPGDVSVRGCACVAQDFHARFQAIGREYRYTVWNSSRRSASRRLYTYRVGHPLDVALMDRAARALQGTWDFRGFASDPDRYRSTVRRVFTARVTAEGQLVVFRIDAEGFLQGMIRSIMGTLIDIGSRRSEPERVQEILNTGERDKAGACVPACGLCLHRVRYPGGEPRWR